MIFSIVVLVAAVLAGAVAAVSGFGVGSLLTPLLAMRYGAKLAVAIVSVSAPGRDYGTFRPPPGALGSTSVPKLRNPQCCRWPAWGIAQRLLSVEFESTNCWRKFTITFQF